MEQHKERIGVIGAGVMGRGVAIRFASYGYEIVLLDNDHQVIEKAETEIKRQIKFLNMMKKEFDEEMILKNIRFTDRYEELQQMDFMIENVPENVLLKQEVYKKLEQFCKNDCIYLVNTSCIPITQIAAVTKRCDKVIGVHFMNPVPRKKFAEVIKGFHTSAETLEQIRELLLNVGIHIEVIEDSAGFVSNRLSHIFMNEAAQLVYEGVAEPQQIDRIFKEGFGHQMGPLETADLIGLDTVMDSLKVLYDFYEEPKYKACPKLKLMVAAGHTGRKSGQGFYHY